MSDSVITLIVRLREQQKFSADVDNVKHDVDELGDSSDETGSKWRGLNSALGITPHLMKLIKPEAVITGIGLLAQAASAAVSGLVGLTAGLAPLVGLGATLPPILAGVASSVGLVKFALNGIGGALGGLHDVLDAKKLAALTPPAQSFARELQGWKQPIIWLQKTTQDGLFPGFTRALASLKPLLRDLSPLVSLTANAIGRLATQAGVMVQGWKSDLLTAGMNNVTMITNLGHAALSLAGAFENIIMAAQPLTLWVSKMTAVFGAHLLATTAAARASGRLAGFFDETRTSLTLLMGILKPFGAALGHIFAAGLPTGEKLLAALGQSARTFDAWTTSARGQNAITKWFQTGLPAVMQFGGLLKDITHDFFTLGNGRQVAPLIATIRTQLLPAFMQLVQTTTRNFGPVLIPALANIIGLFTQLGGANGPLVNIVKLVGTISGWFNTLFTNHKGLASLTSDFLTVGVAISLAAKFTKALLGPFKTLAVLSGVLTGEETGLALSMVATEAAGGSLSGVMTALGLAMDTIPIIGWITAIAALGAGLVVAYKKVGWFHDAVNGVWGFLKSHWKLLGAIIIGPLGVITFVVVKIIKTLDGIVGFVKTLPTRMKSAGAHIWDFLWDGFKTIINRIAAGWNALKFTMPSVNTHIPGVGKIGGFTLEVPQIPKLALGGTIATPSSWISGEAGPEVNSWDGSKITVAPLTGVNKIEATKSVVSNLVERIVTASGPGNNQTIQLNVDGKVLAQIVSAHVGDSTARR